MTEYTRRYRKPGTPLAPQVCSGSMAKSADFTDWEVQVHPQYYQRLLEDSQQGLKGISLAELHKISKETLLCCPEDQNCKYGCPSRRYFCPFCFVPICRECSVLLQGNVIVRHGLINDNWYGYLDAWVYQVGLAWMEKTVASPFWTGLTLFTVGTKGQGRKSCRRHLMHDALYSAEQRVAYKGQVFSAPMASAAI